MDLMGKIEEIVEKVKDDKNFLADFKEDPVKAIKAIIGVDLPEDQIKKVVDGVTSKLSLDKAGDALNAFKKLF